MFEWTLQGVFVDGSVRLGLASCGFCRVFLREITFFAGALQGHEISAGVLSV